MLANHSLYVPAGYISNNECLRKEVKIDVFLISHDEGDSVKYDPLPNAVNVFLSFFLIGALFANFNLLAKSLIELDSKENVP